MIEMRDTRFRYPTGEFELRVGALRVVEGERVAVVGPSGTGKSTLLHLLSGILLPDSGSVKVADLEVTGLSPEDRRDLRILRLGLVFQELELLEYLDARDNVLLPYRITRLLDLDGGARDRAAALLDGLGLGQKADRYPSQLSQGERQRVAMARALVTRPSIVLGDEPTGNLDAETRDRVGDLLFSYADASGAALIVVSHDPGLVSRFERTLDVRELA
jgi:putative ABC transport system ATP-binding protein